MRVLVSVVLLATLALAACSESSSPSSATSSTTSASAPAPKAETSLSNTAHQERGTPVQSTGRAAPTAAATKPADSRAAEMKPAAAAPAGAPVAAPTAGPQPAPPGRPAPPVPTPVQPAPPAPVQPAQIGRMVVYTTDLSILVKSLAETVQAVSDIATQAGGYVAGVENTEDGTSSLTTVRLRVPPDRYDATMRQLRGLAVEVTDEKAATQDVTQEYDDVQTQLRAVEASYSQLLELLNRAQNVEEILKIQDRLAQTKREIDRLKGRQTFLERTSELATVTVHARPASDILARTYSQSREQLRRAEVQRAQLQAALRRARTPEDEASIRDRLGETALTIDRLTARLADIERKAQTASISLPAAPPDDQAAAGTPDQDLASEYLQLRGQLRAAQVERDRLTREQRTQPGGTDVSDRLREAILNVTRLEARIKAIEERARQAGIPLPTITPDQEAALAGLPPDTTNLVHYWWAAVASVVPLALIALFLIWRRRPHHRGPTPSAA
ncbi:MAG: DUF4349 domain-containing protein [Chloroflexi bacterium]|nr:DUF4349 domain-containing protein [Chloroflexota bacterium]